MEKNFRDIITNEKRSIRDIPIPENRKATDIHLSNTAPKRRRATIEEAPSTSIRNSRKSKKTKSNLPVWFFAIISVLLVFYFVSKIFSSTTVELTLKNIELETDSVLSAEIKDAGENELHFSVMETEEQLSRTLKGTGEKEVSTKSSGTIIIYNNYSTATQTLVSGTRFETGEGLIFRVEKTINVPGIKTISGKKVPGSIEAIVVADKPGTAYNVDLTDFTIPGFAGSAKFNSIYARSKTAMKGGNVGKIATVDEKDLDSATKEMHQELLEKVLTKARAEVPEYFVLINGSYTTSFSENDPIPDNGSAKITSKVKLKAYLFEKEELLSVLAKNKSLELIPGEKTSLDFSNVTVSNISELGNKITFKIQGKLTGNYIVDEGKLKESLKGKKKKDVQIIFEGFKSIERAKVIIKPFWTSTVPNSVEKINITNSN